MKEETKTMQKHIKHAKMAEKNKKSVFFFGKYLIFTKNVVSLPKIFGNADNEIKRLIF